MNTYRLILSSPGGTILDELVTNLSLRGVEGDLAIMAGHIPFVTSVKPGMFRVEKPDDTYIEGRVEGGLLTVSPEKVLLLSSSFTFEDYT